MTMTAEITELVGQLAELIKQAQEGNVVLLTHGNQLVAKIVPAGEKALTTSAVLRIHSLKGHRVLTHNISQAELAEEMFGQR